MQAFTGVPATLRGFEIEGRWRLTGAGASRAKGWNSTLVASLDALRGGGEAKAGVAAQPLPRIAPHRLSLALELERGAWSMRTQVQPAAGQNRVAEGDSATAG